MYLLYIYTYIQTDKQIRNKSTYVVIINVTMSGRELLLFSHDLCLRSILFQGVYTNFQAPSL